jgi:DNA polymerase-3 subunit delta
MKLRHEQLSSHLKQSLSSIYFISGDELLLLEEAKNHIYEKARQQGYSEKCVFQIDNHFNWNTFTNESRTLSLFDSKRILECRLSSLKIGDSGSKAIQAYANNSSAASDSILLITAGKLDAGTQSSAWFKSLDQHGVIIQIWPLTLQQLPVWLMQRLQQKNIKISSRALQQLVEFTEGNLLAAHQAIEKLHLLYGNGSLSDEQVTLAITDNASFDVFNLVDTCLQGECKRVLRILSTLIRSGLEPTLIAWSLTREIRSLITLLHGVSKGKSLQELFNTQRVIEKRKPLIQQALKRTNLTKLYVLLRQMGKIDAMIKGAIDGNIENELTTICLSLAGVTLFPA